MSAERENEMINVFLLGDSIKGFYKSRVEELLGGEYKIWTPAENCRFAKYTLNSLRHYFAAMREENFFPDIIHFNVGLWDLNHLYNTGRPFTECEEYIRDMKNILTQLKKTGAKIIFATTTPTRKERETAADTQHFNSEIKYYNEKLLEAIENDVDAVNDLYSVIEKDINKYISDDFLHPSPLGVEALAKRVTLSIQNISIEYSVRKSWDEVFSNKSIDEIQADKFKS